MHIPFAKTAIVVGQRQFHLKHTKPVGFNVFSWLRLPAAVRSQITAAGSAGSPRYARNGVVQFVTAITVLCVALFAMTAFGEERSAKIDFEKQIWPIFEARCFACHAADEQEGKLRLDARVAFMAGGVSGQAVKPGDADGSLLLQRVLGAGDHPQMPLDEDALQQKEIGVLKTWIDQGADWPEGVGADVQIAQKHWAYRSPRLPGLPQVKNVGWPDNSIDYFVLARMEAAHLSPAEQAAPGKLIRRVSLDLVGLPPSIELVERFERAPNFETYCQIVDELLASPAYGEKWARGWLDLARYADTNGFQADQFRSVWPYRDWVIRAINDDIPFDQFTIEQLAGDLLENATINQKIASGFHRLTTCNVEAGVDPEENRINQVIDRVNTTGTTWLGTTFECMQCHNHKYDPFTQKEYYQLFAFFNNTPLEVKGNDTITYEFVGPKMDLPMGSEQAEKKSRLERQILDLESQLKNASAKRLESFPGWLSELESGTEQDAGRQLLLSELPEKIQKTLRVASSARSPQQSKQLEEYYLSLDSRVTELKRKLASSQQAVKQMQPTTTLVMIEDAKRENAVFQRGDFLSRGEPVSVATPRVLHRFNDSYSRDRLGLARWIVDPNNPLTARVTVNRWWAEFYGQGIVLSPEDFGTQSEPPTHPELLDWLAIKLLSSGWSMKAVHREIVCSKTYRQSSKISSQALQSDPLNRFYARGPRLRLPAETIRDNALAISGLLSQKMCGPPVYPPQPENIWRHVGRNAPKYETSTGNDRFRRGLYVFWRRSAPYPSFVNFDAPDRAACVVSRPLTNSPLQALTLLNDPAYAEISAAFADRVLTLDVEEVAARLRYAFQLCTARQPDENELRELLSIYDSYFERMSAAPQRAAQIVSWGHPVNSNNKRQPRQDQSARKSDEEATNAERATWFFVANILLNLDETITKE